MNSNFISGGYDSHQQQYHGSSPRSFKLLHDMTTPENAGKLLFAKFIILL